MPTTYLHDAVPVLPSLVSVPPGSHPLLLLPLSPPSPPAILHNLRTLYLFTKSDLKTILLPVSVFASIMAPLHGVARLPPLLFWIWLHLLQFCVSNQTINPDEDAVNKPWRPIPAGRLSVSQARTFRWLLVAACLALSFYRRVLLASILVCLATVAYNDLRCHSHILLRNACNALGYASFEFGATQLAGPRAITPSALLALAASALIVFTTIHAADFRDVKGDALEGKRTIPISYPDASRRAMLASLLLWSTALAFCWNLHPLLASALVATAAVVGARFLYYRDAAADRSSYLLYNIWLSLAHISLGLGQYRLHR